MDVATVICLQACREPWAIAINCAAMRILYGVVGEGMGHAMRSRVILDELTKRHDVQVVVSGRAYDYLKGRASAHLAVKKIWGYSLVYEDNEVQNFKTLLQNVKGAVTGWPQNVRAYFDVAEKFEPEVVISDFESWSYLFAKSHGLPVVSIDNMQIIDRCTHAPEIIEGLSVEMALTKAIVKAKVAGAFHYYITTFFYPPVRKPDTSLHPPVLRPEILAARPDAGEHLLVYQTSTSNDALLDVLKACGRECRIYGMRRDITEDVVEGNLRHRRFSETGFIDDLRSAYGVLATGGFTLMGEAVYLGRPMLVVPVRKQFEQVLNARYLEKDGYGMGVEDVTGENLGRFLERVPEFARNLGSYRQDGNSQVLTALEQGLMAAVASPR
jgi:uncharacterized protein (TIGR00661 family)